MKLLTTIYFLLNTVLQISFYINVHSFLSIKILITSLYERRVSDLSCS